MKKQVDVAIIGAGSGGLSAYHEVKKQTQNLVVVNDGPYGTTCARVGCMPSKVLIQVANDYYRRKTFELEGIRGASQLSIDAREAMKFVRSLRDRFVRGVMGTINEIGDRNIEGRARFLSPNVLQVGNAEIHARSIVLATGSRPYIPENWKFAGERVITSDYLFEQEDLPESIAVFGTGVIGLELGQALHRLGRKVKIIGRSTRVAGLSDPHINDYAIQALSRELDIQFSRRNCVEEGKDHKLEIQTESETFEVNQIVAAMGRIPNVTEIGLENTGAELNTQGIPVYDPQTMQLGNLPIFIAGDVNNDVPLLHEASDEGRIAGYNAVRFAEGPTQRFKRRSGLVITFCDPNIAIAGKSYRELTQQFGSDGFLTGEVTFEGQGRSIVKTKEIGLLHVYGEKNTGRLLGAEMMGPDNEHLAHLLAWVIQQNLDVFETLQLPYYHPVIEEGLRTALRDLAKKVDSDRAQLELRKLPSLSE